MSHRGCFLTQRIVIPRKDLTLTNRGSIQVQRYSQLVRGIANAVISHLIGNVGSFTFSKGLIRNAPILFRLGSVLGIIAAFSHGSLQDLKPTSITRMIMNGGCHLWLPAQQQQSVGLMIRGNQIAGIRPVLIDKGIARPFGSFLKLNLSALKGRML